MLFPDPSLTASLYCAGHLDSLVFAVVRPVWSELRAGGAPALGNLWFVRYGRGGEHLKLRFHGSAEQSATFASLLVPAAAGFFSSLAPTPETASGGERWRRTAPIDLQDRVVGGHPDRQLLWTDYSRSPISLGGEPFLLDDSYVALLTCCLARGAEIVLDVLEPDPTGAFSHQQRLSALLRSLAAATAALSFSPPRRASYFRYHRDVLLRFLLARSEDPFAKADALLTRFADHAQRDPLRALAAAASAPWRLGNAATGGEGPEASWCRTLVRLHDYTVLLCRDPDYHLDPFAPEPELAVLFKALHGLANHLGVSQLDEALAHHLLLQLSAPDADGIGRVVLLPP